MLLSIGVEGKAQSPPASLRVLTYNIWNGFDWGKDSSRHQACVQWIADQEADVVALQELCGYDSIQLQADAAEWGHPYVALLKTEGYPVGLTSRQPIKVIRRQLDGMWHGMLHAQSYGLDFYVVHLSPADVDFRWGEAQLIRNLIEQDAPAHYAILGDFNAHSPLDAERLEQNASLRQKYDRPPSKEGYSNLRLGEFDYSVISTFLSLPTVDVVPRSVPITARFSFPAPTLVGPSQTAAAIRQNRQRIDYLLLSPALAKGSQGATIFNHGTPDSLSDHYPVMVEFQLPNRN
ncbi:MAG: endonuclease/exonuclease/phosphatase family protein [Bacteroidota bacterium]